MSISIELAFFVGLTLGQWVTILIIFRVILPSNEVRVISEYGKTWLLNNLKRNPKRHRRKSYSEKRQRKSDTPTKS